VNLTGETNATLTITDANATLHDGNYTVLVSNDFGSEEALFTLSVNPPWLPSQLSSLVIWLDADDSASVIQSNGSVSQWNDKSGNGHHVSQGDGAKRPTYSSAGVTGSPAIVFTNDILKTATNVVAWLDGHSIIAVATQTNETAVNQDILGSGGTAIGDVLFGIYNDKLRMHAWGSNSSVSLDGSSTIAVNIPHVIAQAYDTSQLRQYLDGSLQGEQSLTSNSLPAKQVFLGSRGSLDNARFVGEISEVLVFSNGLSISDRQKIEGYLSHKWGLADKLPVTHPHKNFTP
jgi:hypothetical protein